MILLISRVVKKPLQGISITFWLGSIYLIELW